MLFPRAIAISRGNVFTSDWSHVSANLSKTVAQPWAGRESVTPCCPQSGGPAVQLPGVRDPLPSPIRGTSVETPGSLCCWPQSGGPAFQLPGVRDPLLSPIRGTSVETSGWDVRQARDVRQSPQSVEQRFNFREPVTPLLSLIRGTASKLPGVRDPFALPSSPREPEA